jgi:thiol-disulfide isomerase/thioredoxin
MKHTGAVAVAMLLSSATSVPGFGANLLLDKGARGGKPAVEQARVISETELRNAIHNHKGRPVILHFWATWCAPCLAELPFLAKLTQGLQPKGVDFLAVSLDSPSQKSAQHVSALLAQRVRDPHWSTILKVDGADAFMSSIDPNWEGAIPVFFAFDGTARLRRTHLGNISRSELDALVAGVMPLQQKQGVVSSAARQPSP